MPKKEENEKGEIIIYKAPKGEARVEVRLEKETAWLTQAQVSLLFGIERSVITKHLKNIFESGELKEKSNVQKMHIANSDKPVNFYNLDVILSIGYRVNSNRATQFRIWATKTLKNYFVKGYMVNEKRLLEMREKFNDLQGVVAFLKNKTDSKLLLGQEKEVLSLLADYSKTLSVLEKYDTGKLSRPKGEKARFILKYEICEKIITELKMELVVKKEAGDLFGNEVGGKFKSAVGNLYQTFGGKELYKTLEEKASHLFYLVIKDHPFSDGNKRIASFLFVYFLDKNNFLYKKSGERKINDNALVALALLVAESNPKEKEVIIKIILNLIAD